MESETQRQATLTETAPVEVVEYKATNILEKRTKPYLQKFQIPDSDEELLDPQQIYSVHEAWRTLLSLPTCQRVMISEQAQEDLKIQVGVNVTQEFPWRQVKFQQLKDSIFEDLPNYVELMKMCKGMRHDHNILIGYCPILTEQDDNPPEGDPFIFFISSKETQLAMTTIQNMEAFERWRMQRRLRKKPRRWMSYGTEHEMNILIERFKEEPVDVEIQSVYPIRVPKHVAFDYRLTNQARDGVIELLPYENTKYENINRRRITVAVQSAPALINREQQTNPTFPSNAWSQYLYEIDDSDLELDDSDKEDDEGQRTSRLNSPGQKPPPEISDQIKLLLNTLEYNQIDIYRNDYALISSTSVTRYTNPFLQEYICFANISKSTNRFVAGYDWYPNLAGMIAVSYAFSTRSTVNESTDRVDWVQRAVLQPNPVLLWSFSDNLNYQLEFEAPFEVTMLSFCPSNGDYLLGGSKNGQVVVWDLQGRCERLEDEEYLSAAQAKYRAMIGEFLNWTIELNEDVVVPPATMTLLEHSPRGAITGIYWMGKRSYVNNIGKLYTDPDRQRVRKFFITCSTDGTISFWDLDGAGTKQEKEKQMRARMLPKQLTQDESALKTKTLKPAYSLSFNEPITGIIADTSVISIKMPSIKVASESINYPILTYTKEPEDMRQSMVVSTMYGRIHRIEWLGIHIDVDGQEKVNSSTPFAMVHDGPVIAIAKNPFYTELFASIGRTIFAVWKEDYSYSAIFWRKRPCDLTAVAWSETRPAVLYLTRIDGILEAWDILARDDDACMNEILGGGIITGIMEHRPSYPNKILGISDYNSSIRMVKLPPIFDNPMEDELEKLIAYVLKQEQRKMHIQAWEQKYYEVNKDIIEAKREAVLESRRELERMEREDQLNRKMQNMDEQAHSSNEKPLSSLPYNERMARLWDELNLNRMMNILMSRKQMNPEKIAIETAMEKERLSYEAAKKESYAQILTAMENDVANIRSRILPAEVPDMQRSEMIQQRVKHELEKADDYDKIADDCFAIIQAFPDFKKIDYIEFLERGRRRRELLDQSLGANTERRLWNEKAVKDYSLYDANFGYEFLSTRWANSVNNEDTDSGDSYHIEEIKL